jgi:hypothetical protein
VRELGIRGSSEGGVGTYSDGIAEGRSHGAPDKAESDKIGTPDKEIVEKDVEWGDYE